MVTKPLLVAISLMLVLSAACSSNSHTLAGAQSALPLVRSAGAPGSQHISHVIVIIQENRSFEDFFAGYPGANAPTSGCAIPQSGSRPRQARLIEFPPRRLGVWLSGRRRYRSPSPKHVPRQS